MVIYNVVDSIFVSQIGEDALTAVSLAFPMQMLIIAFALGVGVGVNSLIARKLGQGDQSAASKTASTGLVLAIINAIIFMLIGIFCSRFFMGMFSNDPAVVNMGASYLSIVLIFSFGTFIEATCSRTLQATGNMIIPMVSQLIGAITNIILDPIMIFGLLGFPAMGIYVLRVISICFIPAAFGIVISTMFQAIGHGFKSLMMTLLRQLIIIMPSAWLFAQFIGLDAVWFAYPLAETISCLVFIPVAFRVVKKAFPTEEA